MNTGDDLRPNYLLIPAIIQDLNRLLDLPHERQEQEQDRQCLIVEFGSLAASRWAARLRAIAAFPSTALLPEADPEGELASTTAPLYPWTRTVCPYWSECHNSSCSLPSSGLFVSLYHYSSSNAGYNAVLYYTWDTCCSSSYCYNTWQQGLFFDSSQFYPPNLPPDLQIDHTTPSAPGAMQDSHSQLLSSVPSSQPSSSALGSQ